MNESQCYVIRIAERLTPHWADWFDGLIIRAEANGDTTLWGAFADQAALFGVLTKIQALNLTLVAVNRAAAAQSPSKDGVVDCDPLIMSNCSGF